MSETAVHNPTADANLTEFGTFLLSEAGAPMREALDAINAYLTDNG